MLTGCCHGDDASSRGTKRIALFFQDKAERLQHILHPEIDQAFITAAVKQDHAELFAFAAGPVRLYAVDNAADLVHAEAGCEQLVVTDHGEQSRDHAAPKHRPVRGQGVDNADIVLRLCLAISFWRRASFQIYECTSCRPYRSVSRHFTP